MIPFEKWAIGAKFSELTEKSDINYSDPFNSYPYPWVVMNIILLKTTPIQ